MTLVYVAIGFLLVLLVAAAFLNRTRNNAQPTLTSDDEIAQAARDGNLVLAIRSYRALHGVGLKYAKERVEALATGSSTTAKH